MTKSLSDTENVKYLGKYANPNPVTLAQTQVTFTSIKFFGIASIVIASCYRFGITIPQCAISMTKSLFNPNPNRVAFIYRNIELE